MSRNFRLIFMGTPEFAVPTLQYLLDSGQKVVAVYSQPPRPAGRGHKETKSPVHELAEQHAIPVFVPTSLKSEEVQQQFRQLDAEAAVVAAYGLILPEAILEAPAMGCINVHPSKLPRWRGAAPIPRTIMAGDKQTAMTIMQMDKGLDSGDILLMKEFAIADGTTAGELHDKMAVMAGPMVMEALEGLRSGSITPTPQPSEGITYAEKIHKDEAHINWNQPAEAVRNHILGLSPYPGAWCIYGTNKLKILSAETLSSPSNPSTQAGGGDNPPGTVLDDKLTIACTAGYIRPLIIQRPGRKPMPAEEMLRGYNIVANTILG